MDVLVETLRAVRGVRDWARQRNRRTAASEQTRIELDRAVTRTEHELRQHAPDLEPLGPARPAVPEPTSTREPRVRTEDIDPHAVSSIRRLRRHGYKAYIVGGCVRDLLLGAEPKDFDVATDARPEEVKALFRNSRIIGRRFRLVHLFFRGGHIVEVATFRAQIQNGDDEEDDLLIRRDNVFGTEEEDARRRDFTINGLFYDVTRGRIIDHVGGFDDLDKRYLRMIGDPDIRLREDPVRILRAVRFTAKNELTVDPPLREAILRHREELVRCAPARLLEEFLKLLRSGIAARTVPLMHHWGVLEVLMPELAAYMDGTLFPDGPFAIPAEESRRRMQAHLEALDKLWERGPVGDAVLLASLWMAPAVTLQEAAEAEGLDRNQVLNEFLSAMGQRIAVTRKLHEQLRQIFGAQRHLGVAGRSRRRRKPQSLVTRGFFTDAVQLYEIRLRALDLPLDPVETWRQRARQQGVDAGPPIPASELSNKAGAREATEGAADENGSVARGTGSGGTSSRGGSRRRSRRKRKQRSANPGEASPTERGGDGNPRAAGDARSAEAPFGTSG
ncbi:MAG TPA: polynucleotide adenylyltransferase PcnB [Myxococcales bacterium LLY-WYZ-16_1]|nr:polynucleotide adenylyltransferase PcnB [Myxococcales bacterium LLY-WYZ-16_1]